MNVPDASSFIPHVSPLRQETGNSGCPESIGNTAVHQANVLPVLCRLASGVKWPGPVCPLAAASPPSAPSFPSCPLPVLSRSSFSSPLTFCAAAFSLPVWLLHFARRGSACGRRCRRPARPGGTSRPPGWEESGPGAGTAAPGRCSVCWATGGIRRIVVCELRGFGWTDESVPTGFSSLTSGSFCLVSFSDSLTSCFRNPPGTTDRDGGGVGVTGGSFSSFICGHPAGGKDETLIPSGGKRLLPLLLLPFRAGESSDQSSTGTFGRLHVPVTTENVPSLVLQVHSQSHAHAAFKQQR